MRETLSSTLSTATRTGTGTGDAVSTGVAERLSRSVDGIVSTIAVLLVERDT
jgi:hypothetical protein